MELRRSPRLETDSPFGEGGGVMLLASLVLILSIGFFGAGHSGPVGLYAAVEFTSCDDARRGDVTRPKMVVMWFPRIDFSATFPFSFFFFKVRVKWGMWRWRRWCEVYEVLWVDSMRCILHHDN